MNQDLKNKIQNTAFQMFRDWTRNAQEVYTELDFTIIDETILVNDLMNSIQSAVKSLKAEDKNNRREMLGYDIGFVQGFIYSNLNEHWVHEYIRKRSDDYKMLITLKSLQLYLDIDEILLIKIDEIYKQMFIQDVNFDNIYFKPDKKNFIDFNSNLDIDVNINRDNNISISLQNLIIEKIIKIINKDEGYFLPEVKNYFTEKDITTFILEF